MANNNQIYKMSNAGGFKSLNRYYDMLAGNTTWNPWEPQGAFDALATITVPSGGVASIEFSGIPTGYKHLQIRSLTRSTSGDYNDIIGYFNGDVGTTYSWHRVIANGSTVAAGGGGSTTKFVTGLNTSPTQSANVFAVNVMDILDYANVTKNKTVRTLCGADNNGSGYVIFYSGAWYNTAAITSINLAPQPGAGSFAQYSQFALYGVK